MYFRKHYSGTMASYSATASIKVGATNYTAYTNQTNILNTAIVEVLKEAGLSSAYKDADNIIHLSSTETCGFGIFQSAYLITSVIIPSKNASGYLSNVQISTSSGTGTQPFLQNTAYDFYVTFIGEPTGMFSICLGSATSPKSILNYNIKVCKCQDVINDKGIRGFGFSQYFEFSQMYMRYTDTGYLFSYHVYNSSASFSASTGMTSMTDKLIMVDLLDSSYCFKAYKVYNLPSQLSFTMASSSVPVFYKINGKNYFAVNKALIEMLS